MAVTRNDVARAAGVSPAVVSYVLNGGPRPVSKEARARVLTAVDRLGYRPDHLARALRTGRSDTIGLIVPDATNPFFAELARAIEDAAHAAGRAVLVGNSAGDIVRERYYIRNLAERRVSGLILISARADQDLEELTVLGIPVVAVDRSPDSSPVATVRIENQAGAYAGTEHLIRHGHRAIGFLSGPTETGIVGERLEGWRRALSAAGLKAHDVYQAPFTYEGGAAVFAEWAATRARPTALMVASDVQAVGFLSAATQSGVAVPSALALVSFDGTKAGEFASPPLTSVAQPTSDIAARSVALLLSPESDARHFNLTTGLRLGGSCGCPVLA